MASSPATTFCARSESRRTRASMAAESCASARPPMRRSTALSRCSSSSNDLTICSLFISCLSFEASLSRARFRRASSSTEAAGDVALRALVARGGEDLLRLAPLHELSPLEAGSALRYEIGRASCRERGGQYG